MLGTHQLSFQAGLGAATWAILLVNLHQKGLGRGLRLLRAVPGNGQRVKLGLLVLREFDAAAQFQPGLFGGFAFGQVQLEGDRVQHGSQAQGAVDVRRQNGHALIGGRQGKGDAQGAQAGGQGAKNEQLDVLADGEQQVEQADFVFCVSDGG